MPNIKSAKKRVLVNAKKTEQNKAIRSAVKTEMKKVDLLIKENKLEEAKASLAAAYKAIDTAAQKNIYHSNNAANKKSKLAKRVDAAIKANGNVKEEVVAPAVEEVAPVIEEAPVEKKTTAKKTTAKKATDEKKPATRKPRAKKETAEKAE